MTSNQLKTIKEIYQELKEYTICKGLNQKVIDKLKKIEAESIADFEFINAKNESQFDLIFEEKKIAKEIQSNIHHSIEEIDFNFSNGTFSSEICYDYMTN